MQVDFLVRMLSVVVRRDVARNHHHGNAIQSGVGHAGGGVRESGSQMRQHDRGAASHTRIGVRRMTRDLLVPDIDEIDVAVFHRRENRDVRVPAQPEYVPNPALLEIAHQQFSRSCAHGQSVSEL